MPIVVLLVEDSPGDVRLTKEAFRDASPPISLHVADDGVKAMEFLNRVGAHRDAPRPDLVLLDLNLPRMDGREVLAEIKKNVGLRAIPTIILTTSDNPDDLIETCTLQANCFLTKPVELDKFDALLMDIKEFWLRKAKLSGNQQ